MKPSTSSSRRVIVLGSTGSIGVNTLKVVEFLNASSSFDSLDAGATGTRYEVVGLAAGKGGDLLIKQAKQFAVPAVAIADASQAQRVRASLDGVTVFAGPDAAEQLIEESNATDAVAAIVGSAGLPAVMAAVRKGMRVSLANKETLVAAGALVTPLVQQYDAALIPVDSEHSAVFQCITGQTNGCGARAVKRIILTASGGPFRTVDKQTMRRATVEQALKHPTWSMGRKITIDSATMVNKALEIIEAHWLFGLPGEKIDVMIHPQSMVHSFVEFTDHSVLAQLGPPDMKTPIQYALEYPNRTAGCSQAMDWSTLDTLRFEPPDLDKFEALPLAYEVIERGGTAGAVFNAANEAAVGAFLDRKIPFGRIVGLAAQAMETIPTRPIDSLDTILEADREARAYVADTIN